MQNEWINPALEEISLCGECTAYAGASANDEEYNDLCSRASMIQQQPILALDDTLRNSDAD